MESGWGSALRLRIVLLVGLLTLGFASLASPSLAQAESLEISPGAGPTQDVSLSIKVSGVADGHHKLWVFVNTFGGCSSTPEFDGGSSLANGTTLSSGSFEKTYSYTPTSVQSYTLCAYLDENEFASPDITATSSFTAAMPAASAAIEVSGKLTQNIPMKIKVAGTTEVARRLYVFVNTFGGCSSTPEFDGGSSLANGTSISAGSYSGEYSYTPTSIQSYTVCAYVDENEFATPDATATSSFTAGTPAAGVLISVSPTSTENGAVSIKVSGTTEVARKLYVLVNSFGGCSSTPEFDGGSSLANGTSITPGAYGGEYSYTPKSSQTYTVCGYVDESEFAAPDAAGSATFTNITPQTRAEETARNAERAAGEAERGAEVKAAQEAAAKHKYEEEAPAREAAAEAASIARYDAEVAAARAAAHKRPVTHLSVSAVAHHRHSRNDPGYTNLDLNTSPYAHILIKLSRYGHITEHLEWGGSTKAVAMVVPWSCKSPGGTYSYTITAKSNVGRTWTRRGQFSPVSVSRCHEYEAKEQEARERHDREVLAGYEQEAREERERRERYETNCRKLGGEPVELNVGGEYRIYCRAPGGGTIPVPYSGTRLRLPRQVRDQTPTGAPSPPAASASRVAGRVRRCHSHGDDDCPCRGSANRCPAQGKGCPGSYGKARRSRASEERSPRSGCREARRRTQGTLRKGPRSRGTARDGRPRTRGT